MIQKRKISVQKGLAPASFKNSLKSINLSGLALTINLKLDSPNLAYTANKECYKIRGTITSRGKG